MRHGPLFVSVLAVVLLGLVALGRIGPSVAQEATPAVDGLGFVGSWRVVVNDAAGLTHPALITFAADGTTMVTEPPILPAPPGAPFAQGHFSSGNGVWTSTGESTAAITFDLLATDETGNPLGSFTVRGSVELAADGQSFAGVFDVVLTDPAGNVGPGGAGTFSGTRIVVEAMGTPAAATPAT